MLTELELPHLYHSVARNSPRRPLLTEKWGTFQVCHRAQRHIRRLHFGATLIYRLACCMHSAC